MKYMINIYNFATNRYVPLILALFLLILFIAFDGYQLFNLREMQLQSDKITMFVAKHWIMTPILYIIVYAAFVCISAPGAFIVSITGGFLFGPLLGGTLATVAATLGAFALYEILIRALGRDVNVRLSPFADQIKNGFDEHGFFYMVILRVAPIFPFWVINLVPAILGIKSRVNILATFFGIAPACFIYAGIGASAASILQRGHLLTMDKLLTDSAILLPLNGVVLLGALPLMVNLWCYYKNQKNIGSRLNS